MKHVFRFSIALLSALIVLSINTSCSEKDEPEDDGILKVSVDAYKGLGADGEDGSSDTRVLSEESGDDWWGITASWEAGDEVYVYTKNWAAESASELYTRVGLFTAQSDGVQTYAPSSYGAVEKTTLYGTIDVDLLQQDRNFPNVTLYFSYKHPLENGFTYTNQKGTLKGIDDNYDYATCNVGVKVDMTHKIIEFTNWLYFRSEQVLMRLSLKDETGNPINASKLSIVQVPKTYTPAGNDSQGGHGKEARLMPIYNLSDMFAYDLYQRYYWNYNDTWLTFPEHSYYNGYHYLNPDHLGAIEVQPSSATDIYYVALRGNWSSGSIDYAGYLDFTATVGSDTYYYRYNKSAIWTNQFINAEVWMTKQTE